MKKRKKLSRWLLPAVLILFILEILTLPLILLFTYAEPSADHVFNVDTEGAYWTGATESSDGSCTLTLFKNVYASEDGISGDTVVSGEKVIAPGTTGKNTIAIKNKTGEALDFTVMVYTRKSDARIPLRVSCPRILGEPTETLLLPEFGEDVDPAQYEGVSSFEGSMQAHEELSFDVEWVWDFEAADESGKADRDDVDTELGDNAVVDPDEYEVHVYIKVEGKDILPPKTGENTMLYWFLALIAVSGAVLLLTLIGSRRRRADEEF